MKKFVLNNEKVEGIVYKTQNIIIQKIQNGKKRRCYIIGNGHSLDVDNNDVIIKHDPGMHEFKPKVNKDTTVYAFYFTFKCSGLEESGKEIAKFVNDLSEEYEQIFWIGHSKCGLCLYNASYYCKREIVLVTISTPFSGTIIADKIAVENVLNSPILKKVYNMIFSDHAVDRDIIPNSNFIMNIKRANYKEHINITSYLNNIFSCKDIMDLFLFIWDKIMKINGDGLVPIDSQQIIYTTRTINLICSHANSLRKGLDVIEKM